MITKYNIKDLDNDQLCKLLCYVAVAHIDEWDAQGMSDEAYREYLENLCFDWVNDDDIDDAIADGEVELY